MDLKEIVSFTDYFVICTGTSDRMINALADSILEDIRVRYDKKGRKQGFARDGWVIVDYGDIVVHLFSPDQRSFYSLEELWQDGKILLKVQ
jgi:ribosome-associated protein